MVSNEGTVSMLAIWLEWSCSSSDEISRVVRGEWWWWKSRRRSRGGVGCVGVRACGWAAGGLQAGCRRQAASER